MRNINIWKVFSLSSLLMLMIMGTSNADYVVQIGGTIEGGELNSTDLSGQTFVMEASFSSPFGPDDFDDAGTFVSDSANVEFSGGSQFEFDPGDLKLGMTYGDFQGNLTFTVGFSVDESPGTEGYFNAFSFWDSDLSDTGSLFDGFDPEVLKPFFYSDFTNTLTLSFDTTNSNGDSLVISSVGLPAFYNAVPEPCTVSLLMIGVFGFASQRRRRCTVQ